MGLPLIHGLQALERSSYAQVFLFLSQYLAQSPKHSRCKQMCWVSITTGHPQSSSILPVSKASSKVTSSPLSLKPRQSINMPSSKALPISNTLNKPSNSPTFRLLPWTTITTKKKYYVTLDGGIIIKNISLPNIILLLFWHLCRLRNDSFNTVCEAYL